MAPANVLDFWFGELDPKQWWVEDKQLDNTMRARFGALHQQAARCELYAWRRDLPGRLAEIIVLDQFSRNIHRHTAAAFACDAQALALAQEAISACVVPVLEPARRAFLYMPFMHSESPVIHVVAAALFAEPGLEINRKSAIEHKAIVDRFGRYPHRNAALGRRSSDEEIAFLKTPGSSF